MTIAHELRNFLNIQEALHNIKKNKPTNLILYKVAEELNELASKLLKKAIPLDNNDLEEVVDVQIQILLLEKLFDDREKLRMINKKVDKFVNSKDYGKYVRPL